jgi:NodT family efflux transporter outer membrane factor (OMF) lipoprotein
LNTQLENNKKVLELTELRFSKSSATALDVLQQRDTVARIRTLLPPERATEQTLQHELAVLLGQPPRSDLGLSTSSFPILPDLPATGLPIELLQRRPDLRAASQRLQAAEWNVASARADRLPSLRLSGSIGYSADDYGNLLDNSVNQIAADLLGPLFEGGARKAEVARTRAVVEEQLAGYHQLVLGAIQEVEDALVNEREQTALVEALTERLETAAITSEESMARYRKGLNNFLPVLAAQTAEQETERALVQAQYQRLAARVQLHRALGGDWMDDALNTPAEGE